MSPSNRSTWRKGESNPNAALAHQWYAYLLTAMERPAEEAEREIAAAKRLDPLSPAILIDYAYILHYYRRNSEALRAAQLALEMNPALPLAYFWLARIYTDEARYADAEVALRSIGPLRTWTPAMAVRGYLYGRTGRIEEARVVLAEFEALTAGTHRDMQSRWFTQLWAIERPRSRPSSVRTANDHIGSSG